MLSTVAFTQIDDAAAASRRRRRRRAMLTDGFGDAFLVGAGIALLGLVATLVLIRSRDSRAHVELGEPEPGARDRPELSYPAAP